METRITIGTKYFAILSANFWIGAFERLAVFTICMICESKVSEPTFSACMMNDFVPFMVPELTLSFTCLSTGMGSPVIIDSSILLSPSMMLPSTGIFSPGFTRSKWPCSILSIAIVFSTPSTTKVAVEGTNFNNSFMAPLVWLWALASKSCPNKTKVNITVVASK